MDEIWDLIKSVSEGFPSYSSLRFRFRELWEIDINLAIAEYVFVGVFFVLPFSREMSWMRSGTEFDPFLRVFLSTPKGLAEEVFSTRHYI